MTTLAKAWSEQARTAALEARRGRSRGLRDSYFLDTMRRLQESSKRPRPKRDRHFSMNRLQGAMAELRTAMGKASPEVLGTLSKRLAAIKRCVETFVVTKAWSDEARAAALEARRARGKRPTTMPKLPKSERYRSSAQAMIDRHDLPDFDPSDFEGPTLASPGAARTFVHRTSGKEIVHTGNPGPDWKPMRKAWSDAARAAALEARRARAQGKERLDQAHMMGDTAARARHTELGNKAGYGKRAILSGKRTRYTRE